MNIIDNDFIENNIEHGDFDDDEQHDIFPNIQSTQSTQFDMRQNIHDDISIVSDTGTIFELSDTDDVDDIDDMDDMDDMNDIDDIDDMDDIFTVSDSDKQEILQTDVSTSSNILFEKHESVPVPEPIIKKQKIYDVVLIEGKEYFYDKEYDCLVDSNCNTVGFAYSKSKFMFYEHFDVSHIII